MTEDWMKTVNEIMKKHRFRKDKTFVRFNATKFPYPTIAIVIYYEGRKVLERPIRYLDEFIADLERVKKVIDSVRVQTIEQNSDSKSYETVDDNSSVISDKKSKDRKIHIKRS